MEPGPIHQVGKRELITDSALEDPNHSFVSTQFKADLGNIFSMKETLVCTTIRLGSVVIYHVHPGVKLHNLFFRQSLKKFITFFIVLEQEKKITQTMIFHQNSASKQANVTQNSSQKRTGLSRIQLTSTDRNMPSIASVHSSLTSGKPSLLNERIQDRIRGSRKRPTTHFY